MEGDQARTFMVDCQIDCSDERVTGCLRIATAHQLRDCRVPLGASNRVRTGQNEVRNEAALPPIGPVPARAAAR